MEITYFRTYGYQSSLSDHHFQVIIPKQRNESVMITENYVQPDPDLLPVFCDTVRPRVILDRTKWNLIARGVQYEFNERLRAERGKPGCWKSGYNLIPRFFGKELVLLAWAVEDVEDAKVTFAIQNWLGLVPEERWWLYTQTNAATGHAEKGRGKGWRKALQIALTENPISQTEPDHPSSSFKGTVKKLNVLKDAIMAGHK